MRCVIVTNIPTPYRNPVYALLPASQFTVLFCARTEDNRQWVLPEPMFEHRFLGGRAKAHRDGFNFQHDNPEVWRLLGELRPDVVVTTGFNPTHLRAFAWAQLHRVAHVYQTDGTLSSEATLGWKHRLVRHVVLRSSCAGIAAGTGGSALLRSYSMPTDRIFLSRLCADNDRFTALPLAERNIDVMFSGRLHEGKLPLLFAEICVSLRQRRGRCRALLLGSGPLEAQTLAALSAGDVEVIHPGFVQPQDLPYWYSRARLLLFTTRQDAWGVVANEAMAAGTPVLASAAAGAAGDLVIDGENGRVLPPDARAWADAAQQLLDDEMNWERLSTAARSQVAEFNYEAAAQGIVDACRSCMARSR